MTPKRPPRRAEPKEHDWFGPLAAPMVLFVTTALYFGLTAISTSHRDLVVGKSLALPILGIQVPLEGFYLFGPMLLVGLHMNLLLRQFMAVLAAREAGVIRPGSDPTFYLALPARERPRSLVKRRVRYVIKLVFLAVNAALPLVVVLLLQSYFLPYHHGMITGVHQGIVVVELFLIWSLLAPMTDSSLLLRQSFRLPPSSKRRSWYWLPIAFVRRRPVKVIGIISTLGVLYFTFWVAVIPGTWIEAWRKAPWLERFRPVQNLSLAGQTLVAAPPPAELVAYGLGESRVDGGREERRRAQAEQWASFASGLSLAGRDLRNADFSGARLFRAVLSGADLSGADLAGAHLGGADLSPGQGPTLLDRADLRGARLSGADFTGASLRAADLRDATGSMVSFRDADLVDARAEGVVLNGVDALAAHMDGIDLRGASLRVARLDEALLRGAMLTGARLEGSTLRNADLTGAWLAAVDARGADFSYAKTRGAVLDSAHLDATTGLLVQDMALAGASVGVANLKQALHLVQRRETFEYHPGSQLPAPSLSDLRGIEDGAFTAESLDELEATLVAEVQDSPWLPMLTERLMEVRGEGEEGKEGGESGESSGPELKVSSPKGYAQLLVDEKGQRPKWLSDVIEPESAEFFRVLARELTIQACRSEAPQLMEATIRRAVGCTGPREPQLEEGLARNLLILYQDQRKHDRGESMLKAPPCPALSEAPERVLDGLELALANHRACDHASEVAPAPQSLCDLGPFLNRSAEREGCAR